MQENTSLCFPHLGEAMRRSSIPFLNYDHYPIPPSQWAVSGVSDGPGVGHGVEGGRRTDGAFQDKYFFAIKWNIMGILSHFQFYSFTIMLTPFFCSLPDQMKSDIFIGQLTALKSIS